MDRNSNQHTARWISGDPEHDIEVRTSRALIEDSIALINALEKHYEDLDVHILMVRKGDLALLRDILQKTLQSAPPGDSLTIRLHRHRFVDWSSIYTYRANYRDPALEALYAEKPQFEQHAKITAAWVHKTARDLDLNSKEKHDGPTN